MSERWNFTLMIFKKSFNALDPFSDAAAVKKRKAKKNYYGAHKIYQVFSSVRLLLASCGSAKNEVRIENRKRENYNVFSSCLRQTILNFHFCILLFSLVHQHLFAVFSVHFRWEAEKRKKKRIKSSKKSCWKLNAATKEYKKKCLRFELEIWKSSTVFVLEPARRCCCITLGSEEHKKEIEKNGWWSRHKCDARPTPSHDELQFWPFQRDVYQRGKNDAARILPCRSRSGANYWWWWCALLTRTTWCAGEHLRVLNQKFKYLHLFHFFTEMHGVCMIVQRRDDPKLFSRFFFPKMSENLLRHF